MPPRRPSSPLPPVPSARERTRLLRALEADEDALTLEVDGHAVDVTHLSRVYWPASPAMSAPAVTKRDYLRYLVEVAPALLPPLAGRPLTLFRWPTGISGRRVRQKHWEIPVPAFVSRTAIFSESKSAADDYICCDNLATLLWLGHMGALELHGWHSRVRPDSDSASRRTDFAASLAALRASVIEYPDYLLFDIDPFLDPAEVASGSPAAAATASARDFAACREVALWLKDVLDGMALTALLKTSGRTGLHVAVPIERTLPFEAVRDVARLIGGHLAAAHPRVITLDWSVRSRTGKVFLDVNMNVRGKSMPAPWSVRGVPGAPVSMPLDWAELPRVSPLDFRLDTALPRLARHGAAWNALLTGKQSLEAHIAAGARRG